MKTNQAEAAAKPRPNSGTYRKQRNLAILFLTPWVIGFLCFALYPIVTTLYYSFTEYNLFQPPQWVGLQNYIAMFHDSAFYKSAYNSLFYVVFGVGTQLALAFFTAILLNMNVKGRALFRTVYYLPSLVPPVASALIWVWILNPEYGLINNFLRFLHLPQPMWLSSAEWSKPAMIIMMLWSVGNTMVVYLAGVGDIPREYYEALVIDGGGAWQKFRHIIWPMLTPVTLFQLINGIIGGFNMFTQSYVVASTVQGLAEHMGGVKDSLLFYAVNFYREAFYYMRFGYASALAWFMLLLVLVVTMLLMKSSKKWVYYGED